MQQTDTRSLQQIKRETEQTRAGLTDTVEQLRTSVTETANDIRQRISPDAIKAEVSGYIKSRGEQLLNDVTAAARRNPIQAVAVGASIAYPLFRMARAIPVPVLMVGAGLFFAGSKTGQSATQKASDIAADLSEEGMRRAREFGDQVGETAAVAKRYASDQLDRVSAAVSGGVDQVNRAAGSMGAALASDLRRLQDKAGSFTTSMAGRAANMTQEGAQKIGAASAALRDQASSVGDTAVSLGNALSDRATDLRDQGVRLAGSAAAAVQDIATGATAAARNAVGDATGAARDAIGGRAAAGMDAARMVRDKASDLTDRTGKTVRQTIEEHPLLVAGVGLLIGGLIASSLPRSSVEGGLVGDANTAVKRKAKAAAAQGFDAARQAAAEVYDETTRRAEAEGLTSEGMARTAQDISQRLRRVAESAVTTAFEPNQDNRPAGDPQPTTHGDPDHG